MDRIATAKDLPYRVGFTGHSGHLRFEPLSPVARSDPLNSFPDFVLPPAFAEETPESIKEYIKENYLLPRLDPDEFSPEKVGRQWDFDWFDKAKVHLEPSVPRSVVVPKWELPFRRSIKGENGQWEPNSVEVEVSELIVEGDVSGSMTHQASSSTDFVRGSINNRPFRPGGLGNTQSLERIIPIGASDGGWAHEVINGGPALIVPPSFKHGLDLGDLEGYPCTWNVYSKQSVVKGTTDDKLSGFSIQFDELYKKAWEEDIASNSEEDGAHSLHADVESVKSEQEVIINVDLVDDIDDSDSTLLDTILSVEADSEDHGGWQKEEAWAVSGNGGIADHFHELVPDMVMDFPFELDAFQKEAIYYIERGKSVFVAAHTSAGKTVVAEYALALASKHCTRAVYTAPIKTISNQKYRDFCGKFDVGILTGDVSLRPDASCLIMTTEILRSMLYKGADIIRDIEWVIFDEVHYVNDVDRGVVWEEIIIMLPKHINIVLLSATVPNTIEFADWIGRTKEKKIHVTGTTRRPVPLEHCIFYSGELYRIYENQTFLPEGLKAATDFYKKKNLRTTTRDINQTHKNENPFRGKRNMHSGPQISGNLYGTTGGMHKSESNWMSKQSEASIWNLLLNKLMKMSLLPVVIFCFSKNRCDKSAGNLSGADLTSKSEKSEIRVFCDKAFSRLKGSDRHLPQVVRVQNLLHKGIGVHHAGLLPIVKEVVEMLFCRGVIKVLFSTETFALGVNAPARTVVFDTLRKFDGRQFRELLPGEYTQMAGRAGRRGLDKIGTVVTMCRDEILEESVLKNIINGNVKKLESQFRLTFIMILHLLRVEELKVEDMLKRSFAEFHAQTKLPEQQRLLMIKRAQSMKTIECIKGEPGIEEYYDLYSKAKEYDSQILGTVMHFFEDKKIVCGRVVIVKSSSAHNHLLGVIVRSPSSSSEQYIVLVLRLDLPPTMQTNPPSGILENKESGDFSKCELLVPKSKRAFVADYNSFSSGRRAPGPVNIKIRLPHTGTAAGVRYEVRGIDKKEFLSICACKLTIDEAGLLQDVSIHAYAKTVQDLLKLRSTGNNFPPTLDPVKELKVKDPETVDAYKKSNLLLSKMSENKCHGCVKLEEHIKWATEIKNHKKDLSELEFQMSDEALQQMPDFYYRMEVLKDIGCVDSELMVQIKGRVACEMNSAEELICTECLFENQLDDLDPEEAVALMSALVFQQKKASQPSLTPKLSKATTRLYSTAMKLGEIQKGFGIQIEPDEYARENLKFGLVEVVYEWAKGTPFSDICELTDVPEGLIVRTIVRLDETCREFKNASAIMGNTALCNKMEVASNAIRRDIVFAASLYVTGI